MAEMLIMNPAKRKRRKKTVKKRRKVPARRTSSVKRSKSVTRRYRKNPARRSRMKVGNVMTTALIPSAIAAGGAIGLDVIMGYLPVPDNLKTGPMRHLVKGAGAIGMGMLAGMFLKPKTAELVTVGALTVVMHNAGKEMVQTFAPNIKLGSVEDDYDELSYVSPGMPVGEYLNEYVSDDEGGMDAYLNGISLEDELEL